MNEIVQGLAQAFWLVPSDEYSRFSAEPHR